MLHLLGQPVANDMSGRVLAAAVGGAPNLALRPVVRVASYENGEARGAPIVSYYDDAIMGRLEALGYLDEPSAVADETDGPRGAGPIEGATP